jgi:hypothetical protein
MANTFLTMQTECQAVGPFGTTTASAGRIKLWLNQAMHWFLAGREWSFQEARVTVASVSGTADYVLTGTAPIVTDFETLISVVHNQANGGTTFIKLRELQQQDFDDITAVAGATTGIPLFYTLRGGTPQTTSATILSAGNQALSVWPVPNYIGSFKISYLRSVASCEMTADTDVCIVPVQWQSAVIHKAAAIGLRSKGQILQAQALDQGAEEVRANAIAEDSRARLSDYPAGERPQMAPQQLAQGIANPAISPYGAKVA